MHEAIQIRVKLGVLSHVGVGLAGRRRVQGRLGQWTVEPDRVWPGRVGQAWRRWAAWLAVLAVLALLAVVMVAWRGGSMATGPAPMVAAPSVPASSVVSHPMAASGASEPHAAASLPTVYAAAAQASFPPGSPSRMGTLPSLPQPLLAPVSTPAPRSPMGEAQAPPAGFGEVPLPPPAAADVRRPSPRPRPMRPPPRVTRPVPAVEAGTGELEGKGLASTVDERAARPVRTDVLVAIKNGRTVVVPDERGLPVAVQVGDRLPSGARLLKVRPAAGEAETDRGLLRLE